MAVTLDKLPEKDTIDRPGHSVAGTLATPLLAALQFLTIVPPLIRRPFSPTELGRAVAWFPLVGVLLGSALVGLNVALAPFFPVNVAAALILAVWVLATGALHLDGFLDSCDGLFGGQTVESRLQIMRDERAGAFAVIGAVLLLLLKFACLASLADHAPALILAPTLGRWSMSVAVLAFPYARAEGLGRAIKDHANWRHGLLATVTAVAASVLSAGWFGLAAVAVCILTIFAVAAFVLRRLPGFTGDIYGALCELAEVVVLLVFVAGGTS